MSNESNNGEPLNTVTTSGPKKSGKGKQQGIMIACLAGQFALIIWITSLIHNLFLSALVGFAIGFVLTRVIRRVVVGSRKSSQASTQESVPEESESFESKDRTEEASKLETEKDEAYYEFLTSSLKQNWDKLSLDQQQSLVEKTLTGDALVQAKDAIFYTRFKLVMTQFLEARRQYRDENYAKCKETLQQVLYDAKTNHFDQINKLATKMLAEIGST